MCVKMRKLNVQIRDEIDSRFRERVFKKKGMKKGNLTEAIEEAMLMWITNTDAPEEEKS